MNSEYVKHMSKAPQTIVRLFYSKRQSEIVKLVNEIRGNALEK